MRLPMKQYSVLPGFGLTLGYSLMYLSAIVLIPLAALFTRSASLTFAHFWELVSEPRVVASYRLTFGAAFAGALVNLLFGFIVAWVLVRYRFPANDYWMPLSIFPLPCQQRFLGSPLRRSIPSMDGWESGWNHWAGRLHSPLGASASL